MPPRAAAWGRLLGVGLLVAWIGVLLGAGGLVLAPVPQVRPRIEARVCFCEAPVASTDRKRLAEELRTAVLGKVTPI